MATNYHGHKDGEYLISIGNFLGATKVYLNILKKNPEDFEACNNLGYLYLKQNLLAKSIQFYLKAVNINNSELALNGLATVYYYNKNFKDAQKIFLSILKKNQSNKNVILNIANLYFELKKYKLSKKYYLKFYKYDKINIIFYRCISKINLELGLYSETLVFLKKAIRQQPKNLYLEFLYLNQFPKIHSFRNDSQRLACRFKLILEKIYKKRQLYTLTNKDIIETFTSSTNFYLAYCRGVDKKIYQKYFELIHFFTKQIFVKQNILNTEKKTIGIISKFFYDHTVGRLFYNLIIKLCKEFDVTVYYLGEKEDFITFNIKQNSNTFIKNSNIDFILGELSKKNFDFIFFPEVGMCAKTQLLASLRIANCQIVGWGHPVTTGSPCLDYFVTNDLMESATSKNDYIEKKLQLNDIGVDINNKIFTPQDNLLCNTMRTKVLNMQSLFKILPEDDNFYYKVVKKISNVKFYFVRNESEFINKKFFHRLKIGFDKFFNNSLDFSNYFFFMDRLNRADFLKNIQNYDLVLDTFEWSGGNTSLEALLHNIPIVTIPSKTMRSRHTAAFLTHIGLDELIVKSQEQLIDLIANLFANDFYYKNIIEKIKKSKENLYISKSSRSFINFLKNLNNFS
jgi:predicted O-linked N-acetylglucosamine transferase (SPINDLY family)